MGGWIPGYRMVALLATLALVVGACAPTGGPTGTPGVTPPPIASPTGAVPTGAPTEGATEAPTGEASPEPTPTIRPNPTLSGTKTGLRWYCCLGTGEAIVQTPVEDQVAADFSAQHPTAEMVLEIVTYSAAYDTLSTQIAGGNPPDVVGPAGVGGLEAFHGQWLDLQPYIDSTGFDMSQYDPGAVAFYNQEGEGQIGLPFAIYPSMLWYNKALFDEAELEYPPHAYGDPYVMPDGTEVEWNYETVREIALILTVDGSGNDATMPEFNPDDIVQVGFEPQRDDLRQTGAFFGAGSLLAADGTTAQVPDAWRDAWHYFYDGMHTDHFILTGPVWAGEEWSVSGYAFHSGNVAMSTNYLWSKYGVGADSGAEGVWDLAAVPSHEGQTTAALNADTFVIHEGTENPEEAFDALAYLLTDAASTLTTLYGAMPAIESEQDAFFAALDEEFPHGPDWQVAKDSVAYADNPSFESFMPKYSATLDILDTYGTKWEATPGLDLDAEIAALEADIQALWDAP
jgi:multiple sugar transport system substrate-binding protein